jgi:MFS family permease
MLQLFKDKNYLRLCLAAFFMSACLQLIGVVLPFAVKAMNGSDTDVGLCFMSQMAAYVVFCILAVLIIDKLSPKKVLLIAAAAEIFVALGFLAAVWFGNNHAGFFGPIASLIFLMAMTGIITAFFWPMMMGWISTGHEGPELTKRFGFYNVSWGLANTLLPVVGGYLMEVNYLLPLALAAVMAVLCLISVFPTKHTPHIPPMHQNTSDPAAAHEVPRQNRPFVWITRAALFATLICIGIFRSQLGILYKFQLGFAESAYGWSVSLMCLFNIAIFYMMGKSHYWHYKKALYVAAQVSIIGCMAMMIICKTLPLQLLASGMAGVWYGYVYSSHQYYGVSGSKKRSNLMAVHETIIGAGFATGSLFGGILSDTWGRYSPYWFGITVIAAGGLVQIILWFIAKTRQPISVKMNNELIRIKTK